MTLERATRAIEKRITEDQVDSYVNKRATRAEMQQKEAVRGEMEVLHDAGRSHFISELFGQSITVGEK